jgi:hypothetical protein
MALMAVSSGVAILAIGVAFISSSRGDRPPRRSRRPAGLHVCCSASHWTDPTVIVSRSGVLDRGAGGCGLIDGRSMEQVRRGASGVIRRLQTGSIRAYAAGVLGGAILILGYFLWR